jgi:hypothetical protein
MSATDSGSQQSKTVNDQITIEFRNSSPDDESELCGFLEEQLGVKVYIELLESVHEHWPITTLFISTVRLLQSLPGRRCSMCWRIS